MMTYAGNELGGTDWAMSEARQIAERRKRRASFLKQLYQWHWISSGLSLIGTAIFALTGIRLNHAGQIEAAPKVVMREGQSPQPLIASLKIVPAVSKIALPSDVSGWLQNSMGVTV